MRKRKTPFKVTRHEYPIDDYRLTKTINAGIDFDLSYLEFEACIAAGLNIQKWTMFGYDSILKAKVVAWYLLKGQIENHVNDAQQKQIDKNNNKKKK